MVEYVHVFEEEPVQTVITTKVKRTSERGLVELVAYAIGLLAYRGRATIGDFRDLKILLDELPVEDRQLKVA